MKTFFIVLLAFFFSIVPLIGQPVSDLFSKLCQVNVQWQNQTDIQPVLAHANVPQNQTPTDWIELHLLLVHQTLSLRTVNGLTQLQQENRKKLLIALKEYANSRVFPRNDYVNYQTPVFIDRKGVHCAVGFLMQQSGHETLAKRIDAEQKFAYIKEIRVPGVNEWACEHGFTLDELAWIQPGYPAVTPTADLKQGVNGTVYALAKDPFETQIFVAGDFEQTTNGLICNNIAVYQAGFAGFDWVSLGTGVNGKVFALLYHQNQLWVGGEFTAVHGLAASGYVARYDLLSGNWVATGTLDGTVRAFAVYNGDVYAGGNFTGSVARWNGSDWQTIPNNLINGEVRTLEVWNQLLVIGGNFDILTGVPRKHAIAYDGSQMVLVGNGTPTPVNDLHSHDGILYAACDFTEGTDSSGLMRYTETNGWEIILKPDVTSIFDFLTGNSFITLSSLNQSLVIGGDFTLYAGMIYGSHLMLYHPQNQTVTPVLNSDGIIYSVLSSPTVVYFGGAFTQNLNQVLNHVGYFATTAVPISTTKLNNRTFRIYPNPTTEFVQIDLSEEIAIDEINIVDIQGKLCKQIKGIQRNQKIDITNLPSGFYCLQIHFNNQSTTYMLQKQ